MAGDRFSYISKAMRRDRLVSHRPDHSKSHGHRLLRLEVLEVRSLLSLSIPGYAVPQDVALMDAGGVAPLTSASPTGYTPTQIRQAYGFDKISSSTAWRRRRERDDDCDSRRL